MALATLVSSQKQKLTIAKNFKKSDSEKAVFQRGISELSLCRSWTLALRLGLKLLKGVLYCFLEAFNLETVIMITPRHSRVGGDIAAAYNMETISALTQTKDLIGAVLRIHFCLEEFLNVWSSKITKCENFFDFSNRVSFEMKLSISKKLGLPDELHAVFKIINKIRNKLAHNTNIEISDQDLDDIRHAINKVPSYGSEAMPKIIGSSVCGCVDGRDLSWEMDGVTVFDRLIIIYFIFSMKCLSVFNKEFSERGIAFSFTE